MRVSPSLRGGIRGGLAFTGVAVPSGVHVEACIVSTDVPILYQGGLLRAVLSLRRFWRKEHKPLPLQGFRSEAHTGFEPVPPP